MPPAARVGGQRPGRRRRASRRPAPATSARAARRGSQDAARQYRRREPGRTRESHQDRGVETPAFRPGRKRRFTSPEMSVVFASVFACPGTGCSPRPPRRRCCGTTAATPGTCGTWPSSSTRTGARAGRARRATWSSAGSSPQARAEHPWLAAGSQTVQQQALRDFAQAMAAFFDPANPAGRPSWRKAGRDEGFRIVGRRGRQWDVRRVSRNVGQVWVPKAGWVRFRWSRAVPPGAKSYRVTMDRAGRWHVAFAVDPRAGPRAGQRPGRGHRPGRGRLRGPVHRGAAALPRPDRAGADQAAAAAAQARPRQAGLEPPRPGQARHRPAAGPRDGPAQGLGREGQHGHRAAVRPDPGRGPADQEHDPVREGHARRTRAGTSAPRPG